MAKQIGSIVKFSGGISDSSKEGIPDSFEFGRSIDFRTDAKQLTILPRTTKISGTIVEGLPKWAERVGTDTYTYDDVGNLYKRTSANVWTKPHTAPDASGNGLAYFGEDNYLYYTQDTTFGRFGPIDADIEVWYDDFLGSEGGAPTNTHSLDLESGSSQYAYRADTASLSITGDLTMEAPFKPESLPATGNTTTLIAKWDESGTLRSYKMDIGTISNYFGDGSDGALTIATSATEAPIDSACSGTIATRALTATNASFAAGQKILIHQTRGTNTGIWQLTEIQAYTEGTITTVDDLAISYSSTGASKAQVRVVKQYTNVTVNSGKTYTAKAWNGTVGGILAFLASGTVTITGTISANGGNGEAGGNEGAGGSGGTGGGFRGGAADIAATAESAQGEGTAGAGTTATAAANGNGGGGGQEAGTEAGAGGGGGGNGTSGATGLENNPESTPGTGGGVAGAADLTTMVFGGGGGGGEARTGYTGGGGGSGGGIIFIAGVTIAAITGSVAANGGTGGDGYLDYKAGGGGGGGGSILIKTQIAALGTSKVTASAGGITSTGGGVGGVGRIHLDYYTSYTGTTSPTLDYAQDDNLGATDGYSLRLLVSDDGDTAETYKFEITNDIAIGDWARWAVAWDASASTAYFYKNGNLLGTDSSGSMTAIHDNASIFFIGADEDSGGDAANFADGLCDDFRVWNDVRTPTELKRTNDFILAGTEPGLVGYWKLDNDATDSQTDGLNDLTLSGSPVYSTDISFSGLTSRTDLDQSLDTAGNTYTLPTAIDEGATHRQTFVPAKDPQESVQVLIAAKGTGNWTLTVHDALNREMASKTVATAEVVAGDFEFIFDSVWTPVIGASYHFHVIDSTGDGTVTTTDANDLETVDFHTYYQFLVSDTDFHPAAQMLKFLVIGNGRYLAKWDATTYTPHQLTFPSGHRVRALGFWREYLAIGTWKGTNIYDYDEGRIFFWDGIADTYNFYIDVPEGGVNALLGTRGLLYIWAGYSGDMLIYSGGEFAQKVKRLPKITSDKYVEIFPGAASMWRSMVHFGVAGNSDSTVIEKGVYTWGSLNRNYPEAFGYDYPLSTDIRTGANEKIGMVKASGQELLVGWQSGTSYGVDKVAVDAAPYPTATYESLVADLGSISRKKYPLIVRADFEPLVSGESVTIKYKADRESTWQELAVEDTAGATEARLLIKKQAKEIQLGVDFLTTVSTSPTLTGITLESETAAEERSA